MPAFASRSRTSSPRRGLGLGKGWYGLVLLPLLALVGCNNDSANLSRGDEPVVLTGARLQELVGVAPGRIVAFSLSRPASGPVWTQIPVQVDERKIIAFGSPTTTAGVEGTVYGGGSGGPTALQYTDPNTFVGADTDPAFDLNDELVFMSSDAGGQPRDGEQSEPAGVVPGTGIRVALTDSLASGQRGWVYLFVADWSSSLSPGAGRDYVSYQFNLTSGDYKTTYKRAVGPNPETSLVVGGTYQVGFSDRWIENVWRVNAGAATGVDILDGAKSQFALNYCGRSNATFRDAEGAFVANIDGPVRAIRSFIGANSGPKTERTHIFYKDRMLTITDLRVHSIPSMWDYIDLSPAAIGMTYQSSAYPAGTPIDGVVDGVGTELRDWQVVNGAQGSVQVVEDLNTTLTAAGAEDTLADGFYLDQSNSTALQCWGDAHMIGAFGTSLGALANTDPAAAPFANLQAIKTFRFGEPFATADAASTATATWSAGVLTPLTATIAPYDLP